MHNQTNQIPSDRDIRVERAIVLQTLRDDHDERWSQAELQAELDGEDATAIGETLVRLEAAGVIELAGETIRASSVARYLNDLDVIAV
jgi:hypothetical protein